MERAPWTHVGLTLLQLLLISCLPREYTVINENCPGAEWNIMCRECCEYDQIECVCPGRKEKVGYTIPCCRNEENECDSCLIHPGCTIFENCKSCRNGSWGGTLDDFYIKGTYCAECRAGWYGGDCMRCGQVLRASRGQILLEGYPLNARCEWTIHVQAGFNIELRFSMLSLEFDYMCQYDYVEVRDGDNLDSRIIKKFCGNERPPPIQSTGSSLHVLFQSDGSKNFDGFHAVFEEITACSSSPCLHDGTCILDKSGTYKCACLAGYTGNRCENFLDEKNCSDPGGPLNGYRRVVEDTGLLNGRYAKIGTVIAFFCNNSYVLSGNEQRTCQDDGEWSGKQPICIKACREPKISDLVRQKVLPMQVQSRETPLHQLYSSAFSKQKLEIYPTKKSALPFGDLPPGYQHLHTQLQYECISPFYRRLGSSRRTCLKTGKWSGRAPVCIPICGKAENITLQKTVTSTRWPWQAAIYRTANRVKENSLRKGAWILICSGALVNERTVVVAAHCVTDLGKTIVLKTAELKVVLGKFYRDDDRDEKTIQNLRISAIIVHPNYDPILLDSDIAIIKLLDKARISSRVQPICLSSSHDLTSSTEDLKIVVTGWKVLADIKDPGYKNDTIRMGTVRMVDSLLCEQQYEDNGIQISITDSMFCAKQDHADFSNICPAETGGIAAITLPGKASPELRWHLMGLVSWGYDKTCSLELYSGYTKALPFKDWIEKNLK
ncbi:inactive serine protease PAMR1 isoform X2 [Falco biarmicus]|uniref:inactive serine protease PAMR1 isoform X2 n=1 Tax=Falco peregrinus TaxID=8954 RepID=UPI0003872378|nr:inactive serine protease PAMR1 isoform X2 [Falco peregrinus]XP_027663770.1 inactive serine protease PAMR1 isoform X2 [Falco cherrug]XP_037251486.1 inactive serine protease PAMR1 isoform X2 [Falco rusticolus]XP_056202970.1 inactive serine protease PAMR1 isoform X2 [Falco biarmicus]